MALRTWLGTWFTRRAAGTATKAPRWQLNLENLEERAVPAGLFYRYSDPARYSVPGPVATLKRITEPVKVGDFSVGADRPQLVAVGNFNIAYDAIPDLFVTNADGSYSVLLGDGAGQFAPTKALYVNGIPILVSFGGVGRIDGLASPEGVVTGDFNRDGLTDVAVAGYGGGNTPGAVKVLLGFGNGQFVAVSSLDLPAGTGPTYLAAADLDADGKTDLLVSDFNNNKVLVYRGAGDATFTLHDYNFAQNGVVNPNQLVVADFNGDGQLDVAVANKGNSTVSLFRGLGGGYITSAGFFDVGAVGPVGLAAGDLDGDGRPDLAVANFGTGAQGSRTLSVLRNTSAAGGFSFAAPLNLTVGDHLINAAIGDFNGDGRLDVAVSSSGNAENDSTIDNRVIVLYNQGGGPGAISLQAGVTLTAGANPIGLVSADLNNDGRADLVSANQASDNVSVFLGQTRYAYIVA
jgi:hypothetical protein